MQGPLFTTPDEFLRGFFLPLPSTSVEPSRYFTETFERPPEHARLKEQLSSQQSGLVVVDGHGRSGKTWSVVGALVELLADGKIPSIWTPGEDTFRIFADAGIGRPAKTGRCSTLRQGLGEVLANVRALTLPERCVVFLDDFLGTVSLRPIGGSNTEELEDLIHFVSDNYAVNPIVQALAMCKPTLVVTNRSSIRAAAKIGLGLDITWREMGEKQVTRVFRGIFLSPDNSIRGSVDNAFLSRVLRSHQSFIAEHQEFTLPALAVFASDAPDELKFSHETAMQLFEAELNEFYQEELRTDFEIESRGQSDAVARQQQWFDEIYLLYLAPGLTFPLPSVYSDLFAGDARARLLQEALALQPEGGGDLALRVPNQYYLQAVNLHLSVMDRLAQLVRAVLRVIGRRGKEPNGEKEPASYATTLLRGALERVLALQDSEARTDAQNSVGKSNRFDEGEDFPSDALCHVVQAYADPLLDWEVGLMMRWDDTSFDCDLMVREPGLASAVGWTLFKFKRLFELGGRSRKISALLTGVARSALSLGGDGRNEVRNALVVSYSNLFRWIAQIEEKPTSRSHLQELVEITGGLAKIPERWHANPEVWLRLRMVVEDALIWADGFRFSVDGIEEHRISLDELPAAAELLRVWEADDCDFPENWKRWVIANRLFSLEWHNEWRERTPSRFRPVMNQWREKYGEAGERLIVDEPSLLDDNLHYHWCHLIAQWSVWTRDWCFTTDTRRLERDRAPLGSKAPRDNAPIRRILEGIIRHSVETGNDRRLRDAFFLLGTRSSRATLHTDGDGFWAEVLSRIGESGSKCVNGSCVVGALQAVFELARQGFLDVLPSEMRSDDLSGQGSRHTVSPGLLAAARSFAIERERADVFGEAWDRYVMELRSMTHCEVIPAVWKEIRPFGWSATPVV